MSAPRRALVLSAGRGERMRPLTLATPKPLLEAGGKALIRWHLEALARAGFGEVAVNVSWLGAKLRAALGDGSAFGLAIRWFEEGDEPLEVAGGIRNALDYLGPEPFMVVNGDIFADYPLPPPAPAAGLLAHLVLVPNPPEHPRGDFGLECGELRHAGAPAYTYAGIASFRPELFSALAPGKHRLRPLLERALLAGRVSAEVHRGQWTDVGTPDRLAALDARLVSQRPGA
jgi:N-acetyl-alpha-D-muramate 1-phosphate uridylyltransferase